MAGNALRRSSSNKQIAGVCAGIAQHLGVDPGIIRALAVLLLVFTSAPVLIAYVVAAVAVPEGESDGPALGVSWESDGMRVAWSGAIAPYAVGWPIWLGGIAALGGALASLLVVPMVIGLLAGVELVEILLPLLMSMSSFVWVALLLGFAGLLPRPYALTVTHDALWVERPLRKPRRIDLLEVDSLHPGPDAMVLHLADGELIRMPPPPPADAWDTLRAEIDNSRRRALQHRQDLDVAEADRERLERLVAQREVE